MSQPHNLHDYQALKLAKKYKKEFSEIRNILELAALGLKQYSDNKLAVAALIALASVNRQAKSYSILCDRIIDSKGEMREVNDSLEEALQKHTTEYQD